MPVSKSKRKKSEPAKKTPATTRTAVKPLKLPENKKLVLYIGISSASPERLHKSFVGEEWHCVRMDPDGRANPDIQASILNPVGIEPRTFDAIWCPHILQRYPAFEAVRALKNMHVALKDGGYIALSVPNAQTAAAYVANNKPSETLYSSPAGDVTPIDILYGFQKGISEGQRHLAHALGYTMEMLGQCMTSAGFSNVQIQAEDYDITAAGYRYTYDNPNRVERVSFVNNVKSKEKAAPIATAAPAKAAQAQPNYVKMDNLDQPPKQWKPLGLKKKAGTKK